MNGNTGASCPHFPSVVSSVVVGRVVATMALVAPVPPVAFVTLVALVARLCASVAPVHQHTAAAVGVP